MQIKTPETRNTIKENKPAAAADDLIPDYINTDESAAARARMLQVAKNATQVNAKTTPESQPEATSVLEEHRLEQMGSTSISSKISDSELQARAASGLGEEWVRQDLPSHSIPYRGKEIFLKPFSITILSRVHAAMRSESFTLLVDALDNCINIDIRTLTPPDWNSMLYWLRLNSYVRSPYVLPWLSKYGNENEHRIMDTNLTFTELTMTPQEFEVWRHKGLCFPTVRDMELMQSDELPPEDRWRIEYSQYVAIQDILNADGTVNYSNYLNRKLEALERGGIPMIEDIKDFLKEIDHGIVETVEVVDIKFEPTSAIAYLRQSVAETRKMLESILQATDDQKIELGMIGMSQRADALEEEAKLIEDTIKAGKKYVPSKETIELSINSMHFFP